LYTIFISLMPHNSAVVITFDSIAPIILGKEHMLLSS
jgi:hypothetical protein